MLATLREAKTRLSELIVRAEKGEEVLITVRGRPKARLVTLRAPGRLNLRAWQAELKQLHRRFALGKSDSKEILTSLRQERR